MAGRRGRHGALVVAHAGTASSLDLGPVTTPSPLSAAGAVSVILYKRSCVGLETATVNAIIETSSMIFVRFHAVIIILIK